MSPSRRSLRRLLRVPSTVVAVLVVAGGVLGACSSSGTSSSDSTMATEAAAVVAATFHIPASAQSCLEEELASNATARDGLTTTDELTSAQKDAVSEVLLACVGADQWAQAVAGRITAAVPPADTRDLTTQVTCLTDAVEALDATQRQALLVGLVVIGTAPQTGPLAVQRGDILNGLYTTCSVAVGSSSTASTAPTSATSSTTAAG